MIRLLLSATVLAAAMASLPEPAAAQSPAQSFVYRQKRLRHACPPPLKMAAGACVRRCPPGYRNDGGYCRYLSQRND
jgi:hypothetical protein